VAEESPGYEQARAELAEIVRRLESGGLSLEESLALWERGEQLADVCQEWLDGARQRLDAAMHADPTPDDTGEPAPDGQ
jgi:exodeoxyribonuclease VII small subunit